MSADVITIADARQLLGRPEAACIADDGAGGTLYLFRAVYYVSGEPHDLELWAYDRQDAEFRILSMRASAELAEQQFIRPSAPEPATEAAVSTLEHQLALCLAECIDTTLMLVTEDGRPVGLRLGSFLPDLADRAAGLCEEAGV